MAICEKMYYQEQAEGHGREPVGECLWVIPIMR